MAKFSLPAFFGALLLAGASSNASAWAVQGHYLVGELAQYQLQPEVLKEVESLLADEKAPTLGGVASWADFLRQTDPKRFRATSSWHYINAKGGGCDFVESRDCPNGNCAVSAINNQVLILADRSQSREARRDALKFIVHLVGDLHQPMHAGSRTDAGGNGYQISLTTTIQPEEYARKSYVNGVMGTNLHSVWDHYIPSSRGLDNQQYSQALRQEPWKHRTVEALAKPAAMDWAKESCQLIDAEHIYPQGHKIDEDYLHHHRPLADDRVRLAASRLAHLLNQTLAKP